MRMFRFYANWKIRQAEINNLDTNQAVGYWHERAVNGVNHRHALAFALTLRASDNPFRGERRERGLDGSRGRRAMAEEIVPPTSLIKDAGQCGSLVWEHAPTGTLCALPTGHLGRHTADWRTV